MRSTPGLIKCWSPGCFGVEYQEQVNVRERGVCLEVRECNRCNNPHEIRDFEWDNLDNLTDADWPLWMNQTEEAIAAGYRPCMHCDP